MGRPILDLDRARPGAAFCGVMGKAVLHSLYLVHDVPVDDAEIVEAAISSERGGHGSPMRVRVIRTARIS